MLPTSEKEKLMRRVSFLISLVLLFAAGFPALSLYARHAESLPGIEVSWEKLDAIRAAGCAQFCGTAGNVACVGVTTCAQTSTFGCVNPTQNCGACTGPLHITCRGSDGTTNLCSEYTGSCCSGSSNCVSTASTCVCTVGAPAATSGLRILCTILNNGCGG